MRRRTEHIRLVRAAAALSFMLVVSLGGVTMAAEQAPASAPSGFVGWLSNPVPESLPFRLTGEVDLGAQKLEGNRNSPNFRTYRVIEEGFVANRFRLGLETKDRRWFSEFQGLDIGKDDQNYRVSLGQYGRYRLDFEWDQIPHLYAQGAHSAFVRSEGGQYGFPSAISAAVQAAAAAAKPGILRPAVNGSTVFDIKTRNDTAKGGLWWSPRPEWDLQLTYDHTRRAGTRPVGAGFGSPGGSVVELPEPIEWQTDQLAATVGYSTAVWQLQGGYRLSIFGNDIKTMTYDNPLFATATVAGFNSNVGRAVLAPDNQAHNLFLAGGVNLPMATRIAGKISYGVNYQNDTFFSHTVNPNPLLAGDPRLTLLAPSLRGDVRTLLVNATASTRPLTDVNVTGAYRFYGTDNRTLTQTFPGHVVRDTGAVVGETRFSTVHDYQKQNGDLDVAWRVLRPLTLRAGFGWERWDRPDTREVGRTDEYSGKFGLSYKPFSWLDIGARYIRSWKRIDEYNTFAHLAHTLVEEEVADAARTLQSPLLRKFDEAARDRHKAEITFRLMPFESLDVGFTLAYAQDRFPFSPLGLLEDKNWSGAVDAAYTPVSWLTLRANYAREEYHSKQRSRSRPVTGVVVGDFVGFEWLSRNVDVYDTVGAGTLVRLVPNRLDLQGDYTYQRSIARVNAGNPTDVTCTGPAPCTAANRTTATATSFPDDRFSLHRIGGVLRFWLLKNLTLRAGYTYERFRVSYWQTDFIQPVNTVPPISTSQTDVFLGVRPFRSYEAHIIGGGVTYGF